MNVGICAAYKVGRELTEFIVGYGHPIKFIATLAEDMTFSPYIIRECINSRTPYFSRVNVNSPEFIQAIKDNDIDIMFLLWWPQIVHKEALEAARIGWVNLHPALLPYGRGKHPYYWAIQEGTPFGVTIHFIDESVDGGRIIAQREIPYDITDTGETLYAKALVEIVALFKETYSMILLDPFSYRKATGNTLVHYASELEPHSTIQLDMMYEARDLINRIRGRTFLKGDSTHFEDNGKKYRIKVIIEEA